MTRGAVKSAIKTKRDFRRLWFKSFSGSDAFRRFFGLNVVCLFFCIISVSLNGTWNNGNKTETFVGFAINVYNEFEDEESGYFVTPPPQGSAITKCHHDGRSYFVCNFALILRSDNESVGHSNQLTSQVRRKRFIHVFQSKFSLRHLS